MNLKTAVFGYPRIGLKRELKKALESYWSGQISKSDLINSTDSIILSNAKTILEHEIDIVPSNEFSLYDFILDHSVMFDVVPERFKTISDPLERYFAIARGKETLPASEMTKWFNTNYHYIVPEIERNLFSLKENKPLREYRLLKEKLNLETKPVLIGPFTYLKSAKLKSEKIAELIESLCPVYIQLLKELERQGVELIQIDEPAFVLDLDELEINCVVECYKKINNKVKIKIYIQTYYEAVSEYEKLVFSLPVKGFGFDLVDGVDNFDNIIKFGYPGDKLLILGIVSGRDPWKTHLAQAVKKIEKLSKYSDHIILTNSCPLMHLPVTVKTEEGYLKPELLDRLCFANERLSELTMLKKIINEGMQVPPYDSSFHKKFINHEIRNKLLNLKSEEIKRKPDFKERYAKQLETLKLPLLPTTTIGSFPQTKELRKVRADYKGRKITEKEYREFINKEIEKAMKIQKELGIDVLVHGEFERTDMVEFFAEKLKGFTITKNGWVQSYGSRCVKPPIIYGDIWRDKPLVIDETLYAQSFTEKPVKGILTGPVTILQWSYPRKDISRREIAYQIALALKEEVMELEEKGIKIIQIDEPAFREGLPLKKKKQDEYFDWAIKSFKIVTKDVKPQTQIHTHMCYSDFNEIIDKIYALDADVISIEASRSRGEILSAFENFRYNHGIGIGVYDIHSPRVPSVEEMMEIIKRSLKLIDRSLFWINPDCGLKTREWEETVASLRNMVKAAELIRKELANV